MTSNDDAWPKFWAVAMLVIAVAMIVTTWKPIQINVTVSYPVEAKEASR